MVKINRAIRLDKLNLAPIIKSSLMKNRLVSRKIELNSIAAKKSINPR